jgi:hypothetical protein
VSGPPRLSALPRPDWIMTGMPNPDGPGVWLLASKKLGAGVIRGRFDRAPDMWLDNGDKAPGPVTGRNIRLLVELRDFLIIEAPDYPAAFRALFEKWSPEPDPRPQLEPGRPELGPPRREISP